MNSPFETLRRYRTWAREEASPEQLQRVFRELMAGRDPESGEEISYSRAEPLLEMLLDSASKLADPDIERILEAVQRGTRAGWLPQMLGDDQLSPERARQIVEVAHRELIELLEPPREDQPEAPRSTRRQRGDALIRTLTRGQKDFDALRPEEIEYWVAQVAGASLPSPTTRPDLFRGLATRVWSYLLSDEPSLSTDQLVRLFNSDLLDAAGLRQDFEGHPAAGVAFWRQALPRYDRPAGNYQTQRFLSDLTRNEELARDPGCHRLLRELVSPVALRRLLGAVAGEQMTATEARLFRATFHRLASRREDLAAQALQSYQQTARRVLEPTDVSELTASSSKSVRRQALRFLAKLKKEDRSPKGPAPSRKSGSFS